MWESDEEFQCSQVGNIEYFEKEIEDNELDLVGVGSDVVSLEVGASASDQNRCEVGKRVIYGNVEIDDISSDEERC